MVVAEIQEAAKRGAKMLEIRLDYIARAPDFKRIVQNKPCPLVATIRRRDKRVGMRPRLRAIFGYNARVQFLAGRII